MTDFTEYQIQRYGRHILLQEAGVLGAIAGMLLSAKNLCVSVLVLLVALPVSSRPADQKLDSLLRLIDAAVAHPEQYVGKKTARIALLKDEFGKASSPDTRYSLALRLAEEYEPFVNDSSISYLNRCAAIAQQNGRASEAGGCRAKVAFLYSQAGMFVEAFTTLGTIDSTLLAGPDLAMYYFAHAHVYGENSYYTRFPELRDYYGTLALEYRKKMYRLLPRDSKYLWQYREIDARNAQDYKRSMAINTQWLSRIERDSHEFALVAFYRYMEYKSAGDSVQMMRWLAESVLADARHAVMDQGAMWEMANELFCMGDVDRSYNYICYANSCAGTFGSRQRLARISPLMNDIAQKYKAEGERYDHRLRFALIWLSLMAVALLLTVLYVWKQRNRLAIARDRLSESNGKLQLANAQLSEANRVKDEYVGRFMRLCSVYIDKMDDLRKSVNKKLKARQYDELYEMTRSQKFKSQELDDLYANFDKAFLRLFPSFVADFNALLRPEQRVEQPERDRLTTVLRIFALIRLGITDSSKIAEFLHYSVNTIYNYRAHTKNGALEDRESFENRVRKIGAPAE